MPGPQAWSTSASANDTIDPDILFVEGQPPSTLNDSCRAVMAGIKKLLLDTNGSLLASGGATNALMVSTNQGFVTADIASPFDLSAKVDAANTGPATLSVDGTSAKPILRRDSLPLAPGDLQPGPRHRFARTPGFGDAYLLLEPELERAGTIKAFAVASAVPPNWLICDGRTVSRTAYAALFGLLSTTYGAGDGSGTFNVPDLRGRAPFGADSGAGRLTSAGGLVGTVGTGGGAEAVSLTIAQLAAHGHQNFTGAAGGSAASTTGAAGDHNHGGVSNNAGGHTHTASTAGAGGHNHTGTTDAASHNHQYATAPIKNATAGSGSNITGLWSGADTPAPTTGSNVSNTFTTTSVGDHAHGVTVAAVGDHGHGIPSSGAHTHSIPAIADHTHLIPIDGSGQAHPNVPPGLVVVFAIKA